MNSCTFENSAKRKKNFSWFYSSLQLSFSTSKEEKRGGGGETKQDYVQKPKIPLCLLPPGTTTQNNFEQKWISSSVPEDTHTQAWWCKVSAKPQWGTGKKERSASSREQQSPAIAAFTTTLGTSKDTTLSKSLRNVFAFFSF